MRCAPVRRSILPSPIIVRLRLWQSFAGNFGAPNPVSPWRICSPLAPRWLCSAKGWSIISSQPSSASLTRAPAPSRPARRAIAKHGICVEHWSVLSYAARLEAAARGFSHLPVRSLVGSSLAEGKQGQIRVHPNDGTVEVGALTPDLSFVHAACADRFGNTLLAPPLGEGLSGSLAAREGVMVTVERLVEPEVIRRHAHLPAIPASHVRSVSVVPFGAHPAGVAVAGIEGVETLWRRRGLLCFGTERRP